MFIKNQLRSFVLQSFTTAAAAYLLSVEENFIEELNESLLKGIPTHKSKKLDLIQRVAVSVHVFNHTAETLLKGQKPRPPSTQISIETLKKAQAFIEFAESQKDMVTNVSIFCFMNKNRVNVKWTRMGVKLGL